MGDVCPHALMDCKHCGISIFGTGKRYCSVECKLMFNVEKSDNDCWDWTGTHNGVGYGVISFREGTSTKKRYAHRESYEHFVGQIPDGKQLDHLCKNTRCINPKHLEPVTARENLKRAGLWDRSPKAHCRHGHKRTGANVRVYSDGIRHCVECIRVRGRRRMLIERGYPSDMDAECIEICDALNALPGIMTQQSCCGHGRNRFMVIFGCSSFESLAILAQACTSSAWNISTGYGSEGLHFALNGPIGPEDMAGGAKDFVAWIT